MPFRAIRDGEEVQADDLTPEGLAEIGSLARADPGRLVLPDCGAPASPRAGHVRPDGAVWRPHFAHRRRGCDFPHLPESHEHRLVKGEIRAIARAAGWVARTEVIGPGGSWRADVLAERDGRRVAFEIQRSPQSLEETRLRQGRYRRDGVACVWLFLDQDTPRRCLPRSCRCSRPTSPAGPSRSGWRAGGVPGCRSRRSWRAGSTGGSGSPRT